MDENEYDVDDKDFEMYTGLDAETLDKRPNKEGKKSNNSPNITSTSKVNKDEKTEAQRNLAKNKNIEIINTPNYPNDVKIEINNLDSKKRLETENFAKNQSPISANKTNSNSMKSINRDASLSQEDTSKLKEEEEKGIPIKSQISPITKENIKVNSQSKDQKSSYDENSEYLNQEIKNTNDNEPEKPEKLKSNVHNEEDTNQLKKSEIKSKDVSQFNPKAESNNLSNEKNEENLNSDSFLKNEKILSSDKLENSKSNSGKNVIAFENPRETLESNLNEKKGNTKKVELKFDEDPQEEKVLKEEIKKDQEEDDKVKEELYIKLLQQNQKLKTEFIDLKDKLENCIEKIRMPTNNSQSRQEYDQKSDNEFKALQQKINFYKQQISSIRKQLESSFNIEKIIAIENEIKMKEKTIKELEEEEACLLKVQKEQKRALEVPQEDLEIAKKKAEVAINMKHKKAQIKYKQEELRKYEKEIKEQHEEIIRMETKARKITQLVQEKKAQEKDPNKKQETPVQNIEALKKEVEELESIHNEEKKKYKKLVITQENKLKELAILAEELQLQKKEKDKECRLCQLKINELKRHLKSTKGYVPKIDININLTSNTKETQGPSKEERIKASDLLKKLDEDTNQKAKEKTKEKEKISQLEKPNIEIKHDSSKKEIKKTGINIIEELGQGQSKFGDVNKKDFQENVSKQLKEEKEKEKEKENQKSFDQNQIKENEDIKKEKLQEKSDPIKESHSKPHPNLLNVQIFKNVKEENEKEVKKRISPIKSENINKEDTKLDVKNEPDKNNLISENQIQEKSNLSNVKIQPEEQKITSLNLNLNNKLEENKEVKKEENKMAEILANAEKNRARKRRENKVGNLLDDLLNPKKPSDNNNSPSIDNLEVAQKMLEEASKKMSNEKPILELKNIGNINPLEKEVKFQFQHPQSTKEAKLNELSKFLLTSEGKFKENELKINKGEENIELSQKESLK